jgi:hypothetical protein
LLFGAPAAAPVDRHLLPTVLLTRPASIDPRYSWPSSRTIIPPIPLRPVLLAHSGIIVPVKHQSKMRSPHTGHARRRARLAREGVHVPPSPSSASPMGATCTTRAISQMSKERAPFYPKPIRIAKSTPTIPPTTAPFTRMYCRSFQTASSTRTTNSRSSVFFNKPAR